MRKFFTPSRLALAFAGFFAFGASSASAEPLFGVTTDNNLVTFDSEDPATILTTTAITGLQASENILGMDFRPANGQLWALGSTSRLYVINPSTGAATQFGTGQLSTLVTGTDVGFDFNPIPDAIRIIGNDGQNLRITGLSGTSPVVNVDGTVDDDGDAMTAYAGTVTAVAYTNSFSGVTPSSTTLVGIDTTGNRVVTFSVPNAGDVDDFAGTPINASSNVGLDFSLLSGAGLLAANREGQSTTEMYEFVGPFAQQWRSLGAVGTSTQLRDISAPPLDATAPTLTITSPTSTTVRQRASTLDVTGTASDNLSVAKVEFRTTRGNNVGDFQAATGTTSWSFSLTGLARGVTTVDVKATDLHGNETISSFTVNRTTRRPRRRNSRRGGRR